VLCDVRTARAGAYLGAQGKRVVSDQTERMTEIMRSVDSR
jgi:hypothetical protein